MVTGLPPAPEAGEMYYWTPSDPYGDHSFQAQMRRPDSIKSDDVGMPEIREELRKLAEMMDKPEKEEKEAAELALRAFYGKLRLWNAESLLVPIHKKEQYLTPRTAKFRYWASPVLLFMFCFGIQSVLLHLGTSLYIRYIEEAKAVMEDSNVTHLHNALEDIDMVRNWMLYDVLGDYLGAKVNVPLLYLDLTGIVPMVFFIAAYGITFMMGDASVGMWTKTWLLGAIMALTKGVFDVVTVMPDSGGWHNCKERLGPAGLKSLENLHFGSQFVESTGRLFIMEFIGAQDAPESLRGPGKLRYCADMLVSGHTYFAVLFSLSAYKMLRFVAEGRPGAKNILRLAGLICVTCVVVEVVLVALSKFHYTVDMLVSILLVILLWDSVRLDTIASDWAEGYHWRDKSFKGEWLPCLCFKLFWDPLRRQRMSTDAVSSSSCSCYPAASSGPSSLLRLQGEERRICTSRCRKLLNLGMMVAGHEQLSNSDEFEGTEQGRLIR